MNPTYINMKDIAFNIESHETLGFDLRGNNHINDNVEFVLISKARTLPYNPYDKEYEIEKYLKFKNNTIRLNPYIVRYCNNNNYSLDEEEDFYILKTENFTTIIDLINFIKNTFPDYMNKIEHLGDILSR